MFSLYFLPDKPLTPVAPYVDRQTRGSGRTQRMELGVDCLLHYWLALK